MNRAIRRFHDLAQEYKAGLLLIATILALGWLMSPPTDSQKDFMAAITRVYNLQAQPMVCQPQATPPTR